MRRSVAVLLLMLPCMATAAVHADPLFDIKISGDGHVFEFVTPDPAPVYDHPHAVYSSVSGTGTEDGAGGYGMDLSLIIASRGFLGANFYFSDGLAGSGIGLTYDLSGPLITSVVYVPVSYNPIYQGGGFEFYQDQLISSSCRAIMGFRAMWARTSRSSMCLSQKRAARW